MKSRYIVPNFIGQDKIPDIIKRIDSIILDNGGKRIRANKRLGCTTFAIDDESSGTFIKIYDALNRIHPNCVAWGYPPGRPGQ